MRDRVPTLPEPLTPSHAEIDGTVRVRERTGREQAERAALLRSWAQLEPDERTAALERRMADVLEEQLTANVRTSRLEQDRHTFRVAVDTMNKEHVETRNAMMAAFADQTKKRKRASVTQIAALISAVAVLVGAISAASVGIISALKGSAPPVSTPAASSSK